MIIDSSAIVAILKTEDDADVYAQALDSAGDGAWMSAATYVEISMVTDPLSVGVARSFAELMQESTIELLPFTPAQAHIARAAYRRYGRGSGHRARLSSVTASPTHLPRSAASPCCSRVMTSATPTSGAPSTDSVSLLLAEHRVVVRLGQRQRAERVSDHGRLSAASLPSVAAS